MDTKDNAIVQELAMLNFKINEAQEELDGTLFIRIIKRNKLKDRISKLKVRVEELTTTTIKD